jgi:CheY-like chemotaxis protein
MSKESQRATEGLTGLHQNLATLTRTVRVLVADDSREDSDLLKSELHGVRQNIEVEQAYSAEGALQLLRQTKFDVVFADLLFPGGMSGLEMVEKAREISTSPFIVLTGLDGDAELVQGAMKSGATAVFKKPMSEDDIRLLFSPI